MTFAEKLKLARKKAGMSQEQLAEKLNVSRQVVTKWETDSGIPNMENIIAVSKLFDISIDELFSNERRAEKEIDYIFDSITEYDIDDQKHYDMKFGGANKLILSGYQGEKIRVRLASNKINNLQSDFKVKIDDVRKRIDVNIKHKNGVSETMAKEELNIFVQIPLAYIKKIECAVNAETIEIRSLECDSIEIDTRTSNIIVDSVIGIVEINCNLDMKVVCHSLNGEIAINQVFATSKIYIPEDVKFTTRVKGIGTNILYNKEIDDFSVLDSDNVIELNGIKSELVICKL